MTLLKKIYGFGRAISASDGSGGIDVVFELTDEQVAREVLCGKLRGLSADVNIKWFKCSICGGNYEYCKHETGKVYGGKRAYKIVQDAEFEGLSLTRTPDDKTAWITDLLIVEKTPEKIRYEWNAISENDYSGRLRKINQAHKDGYISNKAGGHFRTIFGRQPQKRVEFIENKGGTD